MNEQKNKLQVLKKYSSDIFYIIVLAISIYMMIGKVNEAYQESPNPNKVNIEEIRAEYIANIDAFVKPLNQEPYDQWLQFGRSGACNFARYQYEDLREEQMQALLSQAKSLKWEQIPNELLDSKDILKAFIKDNLLLVISNDYAEPALFPSIFDANLYQRVFGFSTHPKQ